MIKLTQLFDEDETTAIRYLAANNKIWEDYATSEALLKAKRTTLDSEFILHTVSDFTGIPVAKLKPPVVIRYGKGDYFSWHQDIMLKEDKNQHTIIVQLSDKGEYSGGDFEVQLKDRVYSLDRNEGSAIVFPSHLKHRVTTLTRGERWALVVWGIPVES